MVRRHTLGLLRPAFCPRVHRGGSLLPHNHLQQTLKEGSNINRIVNNRGKTSQCLLTDHMHVSDSAIS